jgi:prepilin-type N-terminal cleavage/methylation domain-containing protein
LKLGWVGNMVERRQRSTCAGFTLLELIVCVGIIGVLSMIATPGYNRIKQRMMMAEAKIMLGSLYTSEMTFKLAWGTYSTRLDALGFSSTGNLAYEIGFLNDLAVYPAGTPTGDARCLRICNSTCPSSSRSCKASARQSVDGSVNQTATASTFLAGAHAHWNGTPDPPADSWTIDHRKVIVQVPNPN